MKRNHIAIAGILASVLVTVDAAWAATDTGTVIASQAYVDAKVGTKQNKLNYLSNNTGNVRLSAASGNTTTAITGVTTDANGNITFSQGNIQTSSASDYIKNTDTVGGETQTNVLGFANDSDHAPSITAVKNMIRASTATGGGIRAVEDASNTVVPTEKAVATALVERINNSANTNTNAIIATDTKFAANPAIQKGVLYMKGAGLDNHSAEAGLSTTTAENSWTTADGTNNSIKTIRESNKMDDYVPTMAAVEARVKAAEASIPAAPSTIATNALAAATTDNSKLPTVAAVKGIVKTGTSTNTTDLTTRNSSTNVITSTGSDTAVPTTALLVDVLQTLDQTSYGTDETGTKPVTSVTQVDGKIIPVRGTITTAGIANGTIVNADISDTAAIAYTKMNGDLKDVNSDSTNATCTAASPCVLTYYKIGSNVYYKWTNLIETDGVTASPAS